MPPGLRMSVAIEITTHHNVNTISRIASTMAADDLGFN